MIVAGRLPCRKPQWWSSSGVIVAVFAQGLAGKFPADLSEKVLANLSEYNG